MYPDLAVPLALVSVFRWVLQPEVVGQYKVGNVFFLHFGILAFSVGCKDSPQMRHSFGGVLGSPLNARVGSGEALGEMDRPVSPQSQDVGSNDTPKEWEEVVLGLGQLNTEVTNKRASFEEFLERLLQSWKLLEKGVNLRSRDRGNDKTGPDMERVRMRTRGGGQTPTAPGK